jgi:hypothetical protein
VTLDPKVRALLRCGLIAFSALMTISAFANVIVA